MSKRSRCFVFAILTTLQPVIACGGDDEPPAGACHTGGTATGSFKAECNQCGQAQCNAELSDKSGSAWARRWFGGDGSCADFTGCICNCVASGDDPLGCSTTTCLSKLTPACQSAVDAADRCIRDKCETACR